MISLVFLDFNKDSLKDSSKQAISFSNLFNEKVYGITDENDKDYLSTLGSNGLDKIFIVKNLEDIKSYIDIVENNKVDNIILSTNNRSKFISSNISVFLDMPIISHVSGVPSKTDNLSVNSTIFSGKADVTINLSSKKSIFILANNIVDIKDFDKKVELFSLNSDEQDIISYEILETNNIEGDILLTEANVVVSAGRGLKGPENWSMVEDLAKILNAATACSKPVSDAGWRPHHEHVGQTGIKISPNIYFAIGISGAIQHLAGVNSSKKIIVINNDPDAPFFKSADYGIVGDAFEVVPKIIGTHCVLCTI